MTQGQLDAAAQAFSEGLAISTQLVKLDSTNTNRRNLAVAHSRLGDVRMAQGQLDDAAQAFKQDLVISIWLVERDPANSSWQSDLAITLAKLNQCSAHMCKSKAGVLLLYTAECMLSQLVTKSPDHAEWRTNLLAMRQVLRQLSPSPAKPKPKSKLKSKHR